MSQTTVLKISGDTALEQMDNLESDLSSLRANLDRAEQLLPEVATDDDAFAKAERNIADIRERIATRELRLKAIQTAYLADAERERNQSHARIIANFAGRQRCSDIALGGIEKRALAIRAAAEAEIAGLQFDIDADSSADSEHRAMCDKVAARSDRLCRKPATLAQRVNLERLCQQRNRLLEKLSALPHDDMPLRREWKRIDGELLYIAKMDGGRLRDLDEIIRKKGRLDELNDQVIKATAKRSEIKRQVEAIEREIEKVANPQ